MTNEERARLMWPSNEQERALAEGGYEWEVRVMGPLVGYQTSRLVAVARGYGTQPTVSDSHAFNAHELARESERDAFHDNVARLWESVISAALRAKP